MTSLQGIGVQVPLGGTAVIQGAHAHQCVQLSARKRSSGNKGITPRTVLRQRVAETERLRLPRVLLHIQPVQHMIVQQIQRVSVGKQLTSAGGDLLQAIGKQGLFQRLQLRLRLARFQLDRIDLLGRAAEIQRFFRRGIGRRLISPSNDAVQRNGIP